MAARHGLQAIWKVGAVSPAHRRLVVERLAERFRAAADEKNGAPVRYGIVEGLRKLYDQVKGEAVRELALSLIASEAGAKGQQKYAAAWRVR